MASQSLLQQLLDNWLVVVMTLGFVGLCFWAFRPGSRKTHDEVAKSIFRNDDRPADTTDGSYRKDA